MVIQRKGYTCDNLFTIQEVSNADVLTNVKKLWIVSCKNNRKGNREYKYSVYMYKSTRIEVCNGSSCR